jgi:hypothetical protein
MLVSSALVRNVFRVVSIAKASDETTCDKIFSDTHENADKRPVPHGFSAYGLKELTHLI